MDADRVWPGDGAAPWQSLFKTLDDVGADPWLSVELFNPAYCRTTPSETARVTWDPVKEVFTGASSDLNAKLDVPYLNGWKLEG